MAAGRNCGRSRRLSGEGVVRREALYDVIPSEALYDVIPSEARDPEVEAGL